MHGPARRGLALSLALVAAACAGVFQRSQPASPMRYERVVTVADGELLVGSAERDVTPSIGGYLAGFTLGRTSDRIVSNLAVRALVIETPTRRFAIIGIDNLGVMREDVDWIKSALPGFANGDVFVCASHCHAGPDFIGLWGAWLWTTGRDRDYLAHVRDQVAAAVAEARRVAAPARLVRGRSLLPDEGMVKNSARPGVFDRRVDVIAALARDDGRPLGTLLHFACHPEILPRGNRGLSADFVGELCDEWRRRGHGQAVFANGALGAMVTPAWKQRDAQGLRAFGERACDLCEAALATAEPLPIDTVEVRRRDVYLPMTTLGFRLGRLTGVLQRELFDGAARSTVGYLRLGTFEAVAVPGEMEPALAETIRGDVLRPDLVVLGLCDDEVGYLMRRQEATNPRYRYERSMSPCRDAGELVRDALRGR